MRGYSFEDIYGEIKMSNNARGENSIFVLVEAKSDKLFFKKFFSKESIYFSTSGVENLFKVMNLIKDNNINGSIGVIDADFRRIDNEKSIENIFLTDGHDVEMMKIDSPAWDSLIDFYIDENKLQKLNIDRDKLKDRIFRLAKEIAVIRYLNYKENLSLRFKSMNNKKVKFINYGDFIKNLEINFNKLLETIENKSNKPQFFKNNPDLKLKIDEIKEKNYDLKEFCNGHDMINVLSLLLKKVIGNENISGTDLENRLTIAYRLTDFIKTDLFKSLKEWEKRSNYTFL